MSEVLASLAEIDDPVLGESIVSLSAVKNLEVEPSGDVSFTVQLSAPDLQGVVKQACQSALSQLPWVKDIEITVTSLPPNDSLREASRNQATGLKGVKHVILCASCKGGVGKSTTAVNLAYSMHKRGFKTGILDVDIYGPSLPTMVKPERPFDPRRDIVGNEIMPVNGFGVKLMSMGFINPVDSFVMRGSRVTPLVQQLVSTTAWGELDYLIIDMPPGTGDIQLTLSQMETLRIDAAVIVTTPQRLSFVDVVKGIEMFDKVGIPSVAVVENMAFFQNDGMQDNIQAFANKYSLPQEAVSELEEILKAKQFLFGQGHKQRLLDMWGIQNSISIPLFPDLAKQSDSGMPYVLAFPDTDVSRAYSALAESVISEVSVAKMESGKNVMPEIEYDAPNKQFVIDGNQRISAKEMRRLCRSPANDPNNVKESVEPVDFVPLGRYAISIQWNDGHQSLMPYRSFVNSYK
ncbi:hypothetical protein GUITHDRAFT_156868 [Guillardia theta CCMP2712]|uniref:Iron-sulfur cluster carrier protein n=1 Tax=Guillardia theta (strain CCMP2712) TaxID=905079 RepID=L1K1Z4_GUITC|nr:hypothetical protein GUITHDRAFT_156868 [Guillardia theta CCMP2712]EKX54475.1 hypothetical protein GUITHDRAFT_156868 [Guillardia theta CCMP2712]|eukprot:XP_005841455.1 hypothetical protein GUITHDRAFT_156868 [Guillardia theta CCMP2712]